MVPREKQGHEEVRSSLGQGEEEEEEAHRKERIDIEEKELGKRETERTKTK